MKKVLIIGGGASGLAAAISAAEAGAEVTLLEKNDSLGKKILVTGNGKCNLTNLQMAKENFHSLEEGELHRFPLLYQTKVVLKFFEKLGVLTKDKNGYVYPVSGQASTVLEALLERVKDLNIKVVCNCSCRGIAKEGNQFTVRTTGPEYKADAVILCTGGKAAPKTGSTGDGYYYAGKFGHSAVQLVPALGQLKCAEPFFKEIAGVRCDAKVTIYTKEQGEISAAGELQITDYGISGIPVFQISRFANYMLLEKENVSATIDFLPGYPEEVFANRLYESRKNLPDNRTAEAYFNGLVNQKVMLLLMKTAGIKRDAIIASVSKEKILKCLSLLREFPVTIIGNTGFENAQVTAGGIRLSELDDHLQSLKAEGLYFAGEILDVDGECGGYNLQWAWISGITAGKHAAKENELC